MPRPDKYTDKGVPWTEGEFLDALDSPADRYLAERLFELSRSCGEAWRWFGARPGGAIFFHPDGRDFASLRILVKDGALAGKGTWTSYPAIRHDPGFVEMAAFLGQDHQSSPVRFDLDRFDVGELWKVALRCSSAINGSTGVSGEAESGPSISAEVPNAARWPLELVDAETALIALHDIRVDETTDGRKVPYQYLVLLWAIAAELRGVIQPLPYLAARDEIGFILDRFAITNSTPNPANPWFALRQSPWWSMPHPVSRYKEVLAANAMAGLSTQIRQLISAEPSFSGRAVAEIRWILSDMVNDSARIDQILEELGLQKLNIYRLIPVESNTAETFTVNAPELTEAERTREEAGLQNAYKAHLEAQGHQVYSIDIPVDRIHLRADLYDSTEGDLIEVKSSIDRNTIRLGLGQVLDYARIVRPKRLTLLLPGRPVRSLLQLLDDHNVRVVYRTPDGDFEAVEIDR